MRSVQLPKNLQITQVWGSVPWAVKRYLSSNAPVKALYVLDMVLTADGHYRPALETKVKALNVLLKRAQDGSQNTYEIMWLKSRIAETGAIIKASTAMN